MTDEVVIRLYRALVEELRRRGHPEDQPLRVSELYGEVIPYGAVRSELDVALNADYEDALLRLLAGERDLLRLEPEEARDELRREVESPYPSVGLFRKFAASKVWVNMPDETRPLSLPELEDVGADADERVGEAAGGQTSEDREPAAAGSGDDAGPASPDRPGAAGETSPLRLDPLARACPACEELIPAGRGVRYCPHCGREQRLRPCPRCDAALEPGWRYCTGCGYEVGAG